MARTHLTSLISIFIAGAVFLSSLHAVQVLGAATLTHEDAKKIGHDESGKIIHDLHHHSDKSGSQLIKDAGDGSQYIDNRSMRLVRDKKTTIREKLARWQHAWEEFLVAHHL